MKKSIPSPPKRPKFTVVPTNDFSEGHMAPIILSNNVIHVKSIPAPIPKNVKATPLFPILDIPLNLKKIYIEDYLPKV